MTRPNAEGAADGLGRLWTPPRVAGAGRDFAAHGRAGCGLSRVAGAEVAGPYPVQPSGISSDFCSQKESSPSGPFSRPRPEFL
ncbi:hypothetical protein APR11_001534 [Nocardia amikacinitolerans]|nr:hypothetical protein [Nocardia amikacinitolerans]